MSTDYQKLAGQLLGADQAGALSENADNIRALADSPDGKKVRQLIGDERKVVSAVETGDTEALKGIMRSVLSSEEGARLFQQLSDLLK